MPRTFKIQSSHQRRQRKHSRLRRGNSRTKKRNYHKKANRRIRTAKQTGSGMYLDNVISKANIPAGDEATMFKSMFNDYMHIYSSVSWTPKKKYLNLLNNDNRNNNQRNNNDSQSSKSSDVKASDRHTMTQLIENCDKLTLDTCERESGNICSVYTSKSEKRLKCVPKKAIKEFVAGNTIAGAVNNSYIIEYIHPVTDIAVETHQQLQPNVVFLQRKKRAVHNGKYIRLVLCPYYSRDYQGFESLADTIVKKIRSIDGALDNLLFIAGHSMGGALCQAVIYRLLKVNSRVVDNIRMITTAANMYIPRAVDENGNKYLADEDIDGFKEAMKGKYLSLAICIRMKMGSKIFDLIDLHAFNVTNYKPMPYIIDMYLDSEDASNPNQYLNLADELMLDTIFIYIDQVRNVVALKTIREIMAFIINTGKALSKPSTSNNSSTNFRNSRKNNELVSKKAKAGNNFGIDTNEPTNQDMGPTKISKYYEAYEQPNTMWISGIHEFNQYREKFNNRLL